MNSVTTQRRALTGGPTEVAGLRERVKRCQASPVRDERRREACCPMQALTAP